MRHADRDTRGRAGVFWTAHCSPSGVEELLLAVAAAVPEAISVKDLKGRYSFVNAAAVALYDRPGPDLIGCTDFELFPRDYAERQAELERRVLEGGVTLSMDAEVEHGGRRRILHVVKSPFRDHTRRVVGIVMVRRDVTETRRLEADLRHAQKMEALGHVAGSIAHDFNNLLTAIRAFAELLHGSLAASDPRAADAREIIEAADRGREITRRLLTFSRRDEPHATLVSLDAVVDDLIPLLQRVAGPAVHVERAGGGAGRVRVDRGLLEQVLVNLVANGRDATLSRGDTGWIVVSTGARAFSGEAAMLSGPLAPGEYAVVSVADGGAGMSETTLAHLFEPFHTTKPSGAGTGLGLSTSYGIVTQAGGAIDVETALGRGTTVTVLLPVAESLGSASGDAMASSGEARAGER